MNKAKFLILALLSLAGLWCQAATVNVRDLGAKGNGVDDDWLAFRDAFNRAVSDGSVTVTVPSGTYVIGQPLVIYSNTTLNLASDATIRPKDASVIGLLRGQHMLANGKPCPMDSSCTHGGYTQLKNVTINGGVWDLNTATGADVTYIMHLWHGEDIKVTNLTCKGNLNHYLNFSGSKNVLVENVAFLPSDSHPYIRPADDDAAAEGEGWSAREAIHLDFITAAGEAGAYPLDATACKDITIRSCKFRNVVAGVGTHRHYDETGASEKISNQAERIIVTNCVFEAMMSYAVSMFYFKDSVIAGNRVTTASGNPAAGFRLVGKNTITVSNNNLSSIGSHAISLETATGEVLDATIKGNIINTTGENGIYADGDNTRAIIHDNNISNAGKCGVQIYGGTYEVYSNNISASKSHGISITSGAAATVRNNTIASATDHGIYVGGASVVSASDNTITKAGKNAIHVEDSSTITASDNTLTEPTGYGICGLTKATVTSSSNKIDKSQNSALYLMGAQRCTFNKDKITSPRNMGVQIDSTRCVLLEVPISSAASHAVSASGKADVEVVNCNITSCGGHAFVAADSGTKLVVNNASVQGAQSNGVTVDKRAEAEVYDSVFNDIAQHGIVCQIGATVTARNNTITGAKGHGVYAGGASVATISGNTITKAGKNAIHAEDSAKVTAERNTLSAPTGYGICGLNKAVVASSYNDIDKAQNSALYFFGARDSSSYADNITSPRNMGAQIDSTRFVLTEGVISGAASHAVSVSGKANVDVDTCDILSCGGHAFVATGSDTKLVVSDALVEDAKGNGVMVDTGASAEITDSEFTEIAQHGIVCQNDSSILADDNIFSLASSGQKCVFASGASYCSLVNNIFEGSQSTVGAVHVVSCSATTRIVGNRIEEPAYRGIRLESMAGGTISGNIINDPAREGIDIVSSSKLKVLGNEVTGLAYPAGIRVQGSGSKNITLSGNVVASDSAYDIRIDECSGCTATGNACIGAGFSCAATGVTGLEYAPGDAPIVRAVYVAENIAEVEWAAPMNATGYLVDIAENPDFTRATTQEIRDPSTTTTRFEYLYPERDYYVRVRTKETYNGAALVSSGSADFARKVADDITFICSDYEEGVRIEGVTTGFYTDIVIPEKIDGKPVIAINDAAFQDCDHAATVTIPDTVREIGSGAFTGCPEKMFDTTTKPGVKLADGWAVGYTDKIGATLNLSGLRGVANYAFMSCDKIKTVNVPEGFDNLGIGAWTRCSSLKSFNFTGDALDCSEYAFDGTPSSCYGYVQRDTTGWGLVPTEWNGLKLAYAEWNVTFSLAGTDGTALAPIVVANGAAVGALPEPASADGSLDFAGWYTQLNGKGTKVTATTKITDDTELFAAWSVPSPRVWKVASVEGGVAIKGCTGGGSALVIPASINGKPVVAIADYAFFTNKNIRTATIPVSVKTIGIKAFKGCSNLGSVNMPSSLAKLGQAAFQDCTSLTEFDVPTGIDYLWSSTFEGCLALERVSLPEGITAIGTSSFANCKALTEVNIPSTVKTIKSFAFFSCVSLPAVRLPAKLTTIEQKAFKNCVSLPAIEIPSSVKTLGKAAFFNSGLAEATVPGSVAKVDDYCFQKCAALVKMTLSEGVTSTGSSVWANDEALKVVVFPKSLQTLGAYAFFRCYSLSTLTNFSSLSNLATLGVKTFKHCTSLKSLTVPSQIVGLPAEMCNYCAKLETVSGTKNVTSIGQSAFSNCPALKSVAGLDAAALKKVKAGKAWRR